MAENVWIAFLTVEFSWSPINRVGIEKMLARFSEISSEERLAEGKKETEQKDNGRHWDKKK